VEYIEKDRVKVSYTEFAPNSQVSDETAGKTYDNRNHTDCNQAFTLQLCCSSSALGCRLTVWRIVVCIAFPLFHPLAFAHFFCHRQDSLKYAWAGSRFAKVRKMCERPCSSAQEYN